MLAKVSDFLRLVPKARSNPNPSEGQAPEDPGAEELPEEVEADWRGQKPISPKGRAALAQLVGSSLPMERLRSEIRRAATTRLPVLIRGESGTGKELVARAIYAASSVKGGFVAVNVAAIAPALLESELFGHVRGAFTGALEPSRGLFGAAQNGVLFLDEIGEAPPPVQAALLRVLENGEYRPVGGSNSYRSNARVIAATHRDIGPKGTAAGFREDLYYRIALLKLHTPPLRDRISDLPELVSSILASSVGDVGRRTMGRRGIEALTRCSWTGNIRQLRAVILRAALHSASEEIDPDAVMAEVLLECGPPGEVPTKTMKTLSREELLRLWQKHKGNFSAMANETGIARSTLREGMKRLRSQTAQRYDLDPNGE